MKDSELGKNRKRMKENIHTNIASINSAEICCWNLNWNYENLSCYQDGIQFYVTHEFTLLSCIPIPNDVIILNASFELEMRNALMEKGYFIAKVCVVSLYTVINSV